MDVSFNACKLAGWIPVTLTKRLGSQLRTTTRQKEWYMIQVQAVLLRPNDVIIQSVTVVIKLAPLRIETTPQQLCCSSGETYELDSSSMATLVERLSLL